jgi:nitroimidazol reductase NimA-like FMN-containing flavoprotein (pyridoxamine 5'-phosphate oxidase superfamily)
VYDRPAIDAILDEGIVAHVGFVDDGQPYVIPVAYARENNWLYLHGSTQSRLLRAVSSGAPLCVTVTIVDGIVLARSAFAQSMNYRSVVVLGKGCQLTDDGERLSALRIISEHVVPGRWKELRLPNERELRQTEVVRVPLTEASAKLRTGPPKDAGEDLALPIWAGVLPLRLTALEPEPDPRMNPRTKVPSHIRSHSLRPST